MRTWAELPPLTLLSPVTGHPPSPECTPFTPAPRAPMLLQTPPSCNHMIKTQYGRELALLCPFCHIAVLHTCRGAEATSTVSSFAAGHLSTGKEPALKHAGHIQREEGCPRVHSPCHAYISTSGSCFQKHNAAILCDFHLLAT